AGTEKKRLGLPLVLLVKLAEIVGLFGGRTRTRTWDPLIKSPSLNVDFATAFSQLGPKTHMMLQEVTRKLPTRSAARRARRRRKAPSSMDDANQAALIAASDRCERWRHPFPFSLFP